jgi:hypothetical protein
MVECILTLNLTLIYKDEEKHKIRYIGYNVDLLPRWLPVHSVLAVGYGEQYTTLRRMQSSRVPILVTASNECLHARKQLIERTYVW